MSARLDTFELTISDLPTLLEALLPVASKWYNLGVHMKIPIREFDVIKAEHFHEGDMAFLTRVLVLWLKGLGSLALSWPSLVAVLREESIGECELAAKLEQEHCPQPQGPQEIETRVEKGRELERGAFGYVCVMLDKRGREICAGKYFHPGMIGDTQFGTKFGTKFAKETEILKKLSHPNIVRYRGSLTPEVGGDYCLLMERMACSLHKYIKGITDKNIMPLSVKLSILLNVANGLSYLHNQSLAIIHRDLTARNVLLTANDPPIAKIADFGNCRLVSFESSSQLKSLTEKPGTPHYMAPEACEEHAHYNTKLDIFAFGHLALFTFTQSAIHSLLKIKEKGPDGRYVVRTEIDRRRDHFKKLTLPSTHPAVTMMKVCLKEEPEDRPDARTLVTRLKEMHKTVAAEEVDGVPEGMGALSLGGSEACGPDVSEPSTSDPNHDWASSRVHLS